MLNRPGYLFPINRLNKKDSGRGSTGDGGAVGGESGGATRNSRLRWRLKSISSGLRCKSKRVFSLHLWFVDGILFKIVSVFEAVVLVCALAFFYLFCGCNI